MDSTIAPDRRLRVAFSFVFLAAACAHGAASPAYQFSTTPTLGSAAGSDSTGEESTRVSESVTLAADYGGGSSGPPASPPMASNSAVNAPAAEMIVVEAWLHVRVADVGDAADAIRARVIGVGGRVVNDEVQSAGKRPSSGRLVLRVPPNQVETFLVYLAGLGDVDYRRVQGTDVSREYHDRDLTLKNQRLTLARLQKILDGPNLDTKAVLEVEKELTRVRGEIEQLEGAQRFLTDRAAMATIEVALGRHGADPSEPEAKLHPGVRGSYLLDIGDNGALTGARPGLGLNLHFDRAYTMDLDFFPVHNGEHIVVLATLGGAIYSDYLGGGQNDFLNPYVGLRLGAGADDGAKFVVSGEVGLELVKIDWLLIEGYGRLIGLIGDGSSAKLQVGLSISVPF